MYNDVFRVVLSDTRKKCTQVKYSTHNSTIGSVVEINVWFIVIYNQTSDGLIEYNFF